MNLTKNSKITIEDLNLTEKAFDLNIGSSKSKTMRRRLISVFSNIEVISTKLLRVNKEVEILLVGLYMNRLYFISSISYDIFHRIAQFM